MSSKLEIILDEQKHPYEGMTLEERNYYLNIIKNCKDICDSEHKIKGVGECEILRLSFKKVDNIVRFNGDLAIGKVGAWENRCIMGDLFLEKDRVIVDYKITRLCIDEDKKEYRVLDEFGFDQGVLIRRSQYNYDMKSMYTEINDETIERKLK